MNETRFTPGPWEAKGMSVYGPRYEHTNFEGRVTRWQGWFLIGNHWASKSQREADARLIAAAPDLYAALKACQLQLLQSNNTTDYAQEALDMARAALAKAVQP